MSKQQRETIEQMLRQGEFDFGGEVDEQRRLFADLMSAIPLPADVRTEKAAFSDVPVVTITVDGTTPTGTILYFHGRAGNYAPDHDLADEIASAPSSPTSRLAPPTDPGRR
ncbi:MAG TPA: hypothetical protein VFH36_01185, partial [Acidimicrobiales bacterium]|nr:hypothetical protein [Acidimicrobiales bacterium]